MDAKVKALLEEAGFRVFGEKVVAGDFGVSGNATLCAQKLIKLVARDCAGIAYTAVPDGDMPAASILYEFNVDDARNQK